MMSEISQPPRPVFSLKQERVLRALLASSNQSMAARLSSTSVPTVQRMLRIPAFKAELARRRSEYQEDIWSVCKSAIADGAIEAVQQLRELVKSDDQRISLDACRALLHVGSSTAQSLQNCDSAAGGLQISVVYVDKQQVNLQQIRDDHT